MDATPKVQPPPGIFGLSSVSWCAFWFMAPAAAILLLFLGYPLVLGTYLSFTDARIGGQGGFIGLENYYWLLDDTSSGKPWRTQ